MAAFSPFFIPQKEVELFDALNEELIDDILGQYVDIYKISLDDTKANIYGEAGTKYYQTGFRVNCLISWEEPVFQQLEAGPDLDTNVELYFHRNTLAEAGFLPEVGDVLLFNGSKVTHGIEKVTEGQRLSLNLWTVPNTRKTLI